LRGIPGTSELFGTLLPSDDLQTEALKAECARRLEQLFIVEPIARFLCPAPGAERLDVSCATRRGWPLTTSLRILFVQIALSCVRSRKGSRAHVSSRGHQPARIMPAEPSGCVSRA
jgi:hypothetical protein